MRVRLELAVNDHMHVTPPTVCLFSFWHCGYVSIIVPEPYQAGVPANDVCVYINTGRWGTNKRMTIAPLEHPVFNLQHGGFA